MMDIYCWVALKVWIKANLLQIGVQTFADWIRSSHAFLKGTLCPRQLGWLLPRDLRFLCRLPENLAWTGAQVASARKGNFKIVDDIICKSQSFQVKWRLKLLVTSHYYKTHMCNVATCHQLIFVVVFCPCCRCRSVNLSLFIDPILLRLNLPFFSLKVKWD